MELIRKWAVTVIALCSSTIMVIRWTQAVDAKLDMISWQVAEQARVIERITSQGNKAASESGTAARRLASANEKLNTRLEKQTTELQALSWRIRMLEEAAREKGDKRK